MAETGNCANTSINRRAFLGKAGVVAGAVALASAEGVFGSARAFASMPAPVTKLSLQLSWIEDVEFAGEYIAQSKGLYAKQGLDVTFLSGGSSVSVVPEVISGRALIGNGKNAQDIASAIAQGAPLKVIGALYQKNPYCIMYLQKKPVLSPHAMIGKTIGVAESDQGAFTVLLKINHINPANVTVVPVQSDPSPLVNGEVDAFLAFAAEQPVELQTEGIKVGFWSLSDFGYGGYNGAFYVTEETLAKKFETLVRFMRAEAQGWEWNIADPTLGTHLDLNKYGKALGLNYKAQLAGNKIYINSLMQSATTRKHGLMWMSSSDIAANIRTFALGGIKASSSMFTNKVLEAVYKGAKSIPY